VKQWWHRRRLRVRLTLWYVAVMVVVLAVYSVAVLTLVSRSVSQALDGRLRADYAWAAEMWDQQPDGTLTWFDADGTEDEDSPWLQVWGATGQLLFRTSVARRNPIPESDELARNADGSIVSVHTTVPSFRVLSRAVTVGGHEVVIQVAKSEALVRVELVELMVYLAFGLPFGVAAAGLGGYALARRALRPVDTMADRARSITAARLSERLPVDTPHDEVGRLATVFNETLGRLEGAFGQLQRFTGDVSHELRTPLTAIRTVGEVGLRERRNAAAYRTVIESMLEEADRLSSLVDRLLLLSRAESGQAQLATETIDLGELAEDVASHLGVLAEEKRQLLALHISRPCRAAADRLILRQALINLVDNAIKYSPEGSEIQICAGRMAGAATLEVRDSGAGIDDERRMKIFDRFYRGATGDQQRGAGLGLTISKWSVEVNNGQLRCEPRPGGGSIFRITLPSIDVPPPAASQSPARIPNDFLAVPPSPVRS
jgi:heavy metal sensor kinase